MNEFLLPSLSFSMGFGYNSKLLSPAPQISRPCHGSSVAPFLSVTPFLIDTPIAPLRYSIQIKWFTTVALGATIACVLFQGEVEFLTGGKSDAAHKPALSDEPATLPALVRRAG